LLSQLYDDLRHLAAAKLANERPGQTLQATALVHEAWLRIEGSPHHPWNCRSHFFSAFAETMRRILVDNARRKHCPRHGGHLERRQLDPAVLPLTCPLPDDQLLAVDEALDGLATLDARAAEIVKLRFFAGLSESEIAGQLGVSISTVHRNWSFRPLMAFHQNPAEFAVTATGGAGWVRKHNLSSTGGTSPTNGLTAMNDDPQRLMNLFNDALARRDKEERDAFLASECGEDHHLRQQVESLLDSHENIGGFLLQPVALPGDESPGAVIGRYHLLDEIGAGTFGRVFRAEQTEPLHRIVAIKVIKAGMDTREVVARFEAERQALALMDHPHIAHVFDAGCTTAGRPYFVMELVDGLPVTGYCDHYQLTTTERLQLFTKICQAVQHAHQKGVIHRDLKPSNILVSRSISESEPKIIDFGVAKALGTLKLTEHTLHTIAREIVGTPAYMSPEQADSSDGDIDTRTDIYSLGVLLYELLTGWSPFDGTALHLAPSEEIRRVIREADPPKPSTCLRTLGQQAADIARRRSTDPALLYRSLHGDLDWIVMRAIEKDRRLRYQTISALIEDIHRHLTDQPVSAGPPSTLYRLQKFIRRHRVGTAVTAASIAAVLVGLASLTVGLIHAEHERDRARAAGALAEANEKKAETEAEHARSIADLMLEMLSSANPGTGKGSGYTVRELLDGFSAKLSDQLKGQPEVEAKLRSTIGNAYRQLGETGKAQSQLDLAVQLARGCYGENDVRYAGFLLQRSHPSLSEAEQDARQALAIYQRQSVAPDKMLRAFNALHLCMVDAWRLDETEAIINEALAYAARFPHHDSADLGSMLHNQAFVLTYWVPPDYARAEDLARQAVQIHRRTRPDNHLSTGWGLKVLADVLIHRHKYAETEPIAREALALFLRYYPSNHDSVLLLHNLLAESLWNQGMLEKAEDLLTRQFQTLASLPADKRKAMLPALNGLVRCLHEHGKNEQARIHLAHAGKLLEEMELSLLDPLAVRGFALQLLATGETNAYRNLVERIDREFRAGVSPTKPGWFFWTCAIGPDALQDYSVITAHATEYFASQPNSLTLGALRYRAGQAAAAAPVLTEAFTLDQASGNTVIAARISYFLAMTHAKLGETQKAAEWFERGLLADPLSGKYDGSVPPNILWLYQYELRLLRNEADSMLHAAQIRSAEKGAP
jgi:eukaryotic-like serine/threonine-protein kinase